MNTSNVSAAVPSTAYALASLTLSNTETLSPYTLKAISEAKKEVIRLKTLHPHLVSQVDNSILIIEDEDGGLIHHEGDLSFLMPTAPRMYHNFSKQLNPEIQKDYAERQLSAWKYQLAEKSHLVTPSGRQAMFFPLYTMRQRFTGTVFFYGTGRGREGRPYFAE